MLTKKTPINPKKFFCVSCNFSCSNKKDYTRHEITSKHKILTNTNENTPKTPKAYLCACGKEYKHASSLCGHKKKCFFLQNDKEEKEIVEEKKEEGPDYKELLILAMTQMQTQQTQMQRKDDLVSEAMTQMSEMRKQMTAMRKINNELVTKMTDIAIKT